MKRMALLLATVGLLVSPLSGVAAQSDDGGSVSFDAEDTDQITFYGHIFGHTLDQPMPANTQAPIGEDNYGLGTFSECTPHGSAFPLSLDPQGTVEPGMTCEDNPAHKLALFSTAGFVGPDNRAEFDSGGGYSQLHNERGQTKDIHLDENGEITATVYMTLDFHSWPASTGDTNCVQPHPENVPCAYPYWGWDVGTQPEFVVEGTLYQADLGDRDNATAAPPVREAIQSGDAEVVANGQWGPGQPTVGLPNTPQVLEFEVPLGQPETGVIDKSNDFILVYETYSNVNDEEYNIHTVRWWGGELFPATFDMPVQNAFQVERVIPSDVFGKLPILGIINTPWGSYDTNSDSIELSIEGPNGQSVDTEGIPQFTDASVAHGGHFKPVNTTWVWDYKDYDLSPGDYTITVSAENFQGSSSASCEASVTLEETDGELTMVDKQNGACGIQTTTEEEAEGFRANPDEGGSDE